MASKERLAVIHGDISAEAAVQGIAAMTAGNAVVLERSVLYPYLRFAASCCVPTVGGRQDVTVDCLVDGLNGHGTTTDRFSTIDSRLAGETVLSVSVDEGRARRTAQRNVTHGLGRKLRMIAGFDVRLEDRGTVYKRFWILRSGSDRIMMDSVTGAVHTLQTAA